MEKGIKYDQEKTRFDLLEIEWLKGVADVMSYGAKKYSAWNWTKLEDRWRVYNSLLRHLFAYWLGETNDKESGFNHLFHVACNVMMLWGLDSRYAQKNTTVNAQPCISEETLDVINNLDNSRLNELIKEVTAEKGENSFDKYIKTENIKIKGDLVAIKWTGSNLEDFKKYFQYPRIQNTNQLVLHCGYINPNMWIVFHKKFLKYDHNKYMEVPNDVFQEKFANLFD